MSCSAAACTSVRSWSRAICIAGTRRRQLRDAVGRDTARGRARAAPPAARPGTCARRRRGACPCARTSRRGAAAARSGRRRRAARARTVAGGDVEALAVLAHRGRPARRRFRSGESPSTVSNSARRTRRRPCGRRARSPRRRRAAPRRCGSAGRRPPDARTCRCRP